MMLQSVGKQKKFKIGTVGRRNGQTNKQTNAQTDARTNLVTDSLLELLIADKK